MEFNGIIKQDSTQCFEARINDCCDCRRCRGGERENDKGLF
jgi:hypothetical protein